MKFSGKRFQNKVETEESIRSKDQARVCVLVDRYGSLDHSPKPLFDLLLKYAVYVSSKTIGIGILKPNGNGLFNMHGNVYEWCQNEYLEATMERQSQNLTVTNNDRRVLRGGAFDSSALRVRSAFRDSYFPDDRGSDIGFRVARTYP